MKLLICVLCAWFTVTARAESPVTSLLFTALFGEIHVGPTQLIKDQQEFPYCAMYAAASFLEIWGNVKHPSAAKLPNLSTAFLAMGYNAEYSDSGNGTDAEVLLYTMKKYGIVPSDAWQDTRFPDNAAYLKNGWRREHSKLIPAAEVGEILQLKYRDGESRDGVTGVEYFQSHVGVDLTQFEVVSSKRAEKFAAADPFSSEPTGYRINDFTKRSDALTAAQKAAGFSPTWDSIEPEKLYRRISRQLYASEPVLISINTVLVDGRFSNFDLVTAGDLLPEGTSKAGHHAVVAVGICDEKNTRIPYCRPFVQQFKSRNVDECLMVQNSWGPNSNHRGVFCLSQKAALRMINSATIKKTEPAAVALDTLLDGKETFGVTGAN